MTGVELQKGRLVKWNGITIVKTRKIYRAAVNIISPNQPSNFRFPKTAFGKQSRSFQSAWFRDYPWLHYDEKIDSAFCYICIKQSEKGNLKSPPELDQVFISTGFSNWKKALLWFQEHQTSECHKASVEYEMVTPRTHGNIIDMTSEAGRTKREKIDVA